MPHPHNLSQGFFLSTLLTTKCSCSTRLVLTSPINVLLMTIPLETSLWKQWLLDLLHQTAPAEDNIKELMRHWKLVIRPKSSDDLCDKISYLAKFSMYLQLLERNLKLLRYVTHVKRRWFVSHRRAWICHEKDKDDYIFRKFHCKRAWSPARKTFSKVQVRRSMSMATDSKV